MMVPQDKLALSIKELIMISGVGRTSIYNEIKSGRLVVRKLGRRTVVLLADVHQWLAALPMLRTPISSPLGLD
jgi:predicted DNA-binding transcriptional regulator AlpA